MSKLIAEKLTPEAYEKYGSVICYSDSFPSIPANQGTAKRFNHLSPLINLREDAKANVCLFRCKPTEQVNPFQLKLVERHFFSTQIFVPMNAESYLVIVCLNDPKKDLPDLSTLKAFLATDTQSISYHPGVWHHPLIALNKETGFFSPISSP